MIKHPNHLTQRISEELDIDLRLTAKRLNVKRATLVREAIAEYLHKLNKNQNPAP
jgi:predicted DNA-binding protein